MVVKSLPTASTDWIFFDQLSNIIVFGLVGLFVLSAHAQNIVQVKSESCAQQLT